MSKVAISEEYLTDIADSIREKLETTDTYKVSEMSEAIDSIETGGGGLDWSAIGYSDTPQAIKNGYNYAMEIKNNWVAVADLSSKFSNNTTLQFMPLVDTSNATNMYGMFMSCNNLVSIPQLDTSNTTSTRYMFQSCGKLNEVPILDLSKCTIPQGMFNYCPSLTDQSLDNILQMCININPNYSLTKTLAYLGLTSSSYPASRIQALPHYQDFINAGWTIGY